MPAFGYPQVKMSCPGAHFEFSSSLPRPNGCKHCPQFTVVTVVFFFPFRIYFPVDNEVAVRVLNDRLNWHLFHSNVSVALITRHWVSVSLQRPTRLDREAKLPLLALI